MSDDSRVPRDPEMETLDLDGEEADLEAVQREALAAVEKVVSAARSEAPGDDPAADEPEVTADEIARMEVELADLRDRSVRTLADFDNFRKRAEREREDMRRYALTGFLRELVDVLDNLDLALAAGGSAEDLKRGVELTRRQFHDLLRRHGVEPVAALGERFDPALHEAVSRDEDPTVEAPQVSAELRRGYRIFDRLLRPAMVRVAVPGPSAPPAGGEPVDEPT